MNSLACLLEIYFESSKDEIREIEVWGGGSGVWGHISQSLERPNCAKTP